MPHNSPGSDDSRPYELRGRHLSLCVRNAGSAHEYREDDRECHVCLRGVCHQKHVYKSKCRRKHVYHIGAARAGSAHGEKGLDHERRLARKKQQHLEKQEQQ